MQVCDRPALGDRADALARDVIETTLAGLRAGTTLTYEGRHPGGARRARRLVPFIIRPDTDVFPRIFMSRHIPLSCTLALVLLVLAAAPPARAQTTLTLDDAQALAARNFETVQLAQQDVEQAKLLKRQALSAVLPNVSVNGTYTRNLVSAAFDFGGRTIQILPENDYNFGFTFSQPIYAGFREQRALDQAKVNIEAAGVAVAVSVRGQRAQRHARLLPGAGRAGVRGHLEARARGGAGDRSGRPSRSSARGRRSRRPCCARRWPSATPSGSCSKPRTRSSSRAISCASSWAWTRPSR